MRVTLRVDSTVAGDPQTLGVEIDRSGHPMNAADVTIRWNMIQMPMDDGAIQLSQTSPGRYEERGFSFSMAGDWRAKVEVRENDHLEITDFFTLQARD